MPKNRIAIGRQAGLQPTITASRSALRYATGQSWCDGLVRTDTERLLGIAGKQSELDSRRDWLPAMS